MRKRQPRQAQLKSFGGGGGDEEEETKDNGETQRKRESGW
jgi:hypothetical protein